MITRDPIVLSYIQGYKITFNKPVYQIFHPKSPDYSSSEKLHYREAIKTLLSNGAISECSPSEGQFLSSIFLIPKSNGKMRFILNLKSLNKFIDTQHFKLEDLRTALKLISNDCYMAKLDLQDAYFMIKIHPETKKYLRFQWEGCLYEFNVLPFGLNTAPFLFTKIMKPVVRLLRCAGQMSTVYLDDFLLIGQTYDACLDNVNHTRNLLTALGFILNTDKSCFTPSRICTFLGFQIDSENFQVSLPHDKVQKILIEINKMSKLKRCKIREFARFVGLIVSCCPAIDYGWLYTKKFERLKFLSLRKDNNYDKYMNLPEYLLPDLCWWTHAVQNSISKIKTEDYCLEIFSDASTTGWGAACGKETASGLWSEYEKSFHINFLEILAAFIGLKIFAKHLNNCSILLRIDNTTAISYINRMGGIQFPHLTDATKQLWQWCECRGLHVFASYIRSADNKTADFESRRIHPDIEWELESDVFYKIVLKFGEPEIDLFASRINKKCNKYISWHPDPDCYAVNAFTVSWTKFYFYAFPPFSVILKTLRKIIADKSRGIMVVPFWPTQPWYPLFSKLLLSEPLIFEPHTNLIICHSSHRNIHTKLTLVVGVLSGQRG